MELDIIYVLETQKSKLEQLNFAVGSDHLGDRLDLPNKLE